jgi:hypothetical protein
VAAYLVGVGRPQPVARVLLQQPHEDVLQFGRDLLRGGPTLGGTGSGW